jgi:hypothetical protein
LCREVERACVVSVRSCRIRFLSYLMFWILADTPGDHKTGNLGDLNEYRTERDRMLFSIMCIKDARAPSAYIFS